MNKSELLRKYTLVKNGNYADIRAEALNFVVNISKSDLSPDKIQGMLLLLNEIDSWTLDYERELEKVRKDT